MERLQSAPFSMPFHVAARLVSRHSAELVASTIGAYQTRAEDIDSPGGWVRAAIENRWFATPASGGGTKNLEGGGGDRHGITHREMCEAIDAIPSAYVPDAKGWDILRDGRSPEARFLPPIRWARWYWVHGHTLGSAAAREWAQRLATARREYESQSKNN